MNTDKNLLFGVLALQMDFISRDDLIAGMQAMVMDKSKSLGEILVEQGVLKHEAHDLLGSLLHMHLKIHGNDPAKSLAQLQVLTPLQHCLQQIPDSDLQASLAQVPQACHSDVPEPGTMQQSLEKPPWAGLRYHILRPHAKGGLGEVFVAEDQELHREVALKEIQAFHANNAISRERFLLEAEITGRLEHPGIVPVYGQGQYPDGRPFYAMRFVHGGSFKEAIDRYHQGNASSRSSSEATLEFRKLLGQFTDVCNAIGYAHSRGVLHRDIKPTNIMLGKYGETLVVDWGLARAMDRPEAVRTPDEKTLRPSSGSGSGATQMGDIVGTPAFMSPEQAAGRNDLLGPASDVYSLGATLYYILTGRPAFQDKEVKETLQQVRQGDFLPARSVRKGVPRPLDAICRKAMALRPEDRYASAREVADEIEHWLANEPVSAWHEPWIVRAQRQLARHKTVVSTVAAAVLVALLVQSSFALVLKHSYENERQAKDLAILRETEAEGQRKEADLQRSRAEASLKHAREAVDRYHTQVSETVLLHEPGFEPLRRNLLEAAGEFYVKFVKEHEDDPRLQAELGKALSRLALITGELGSKDKAIAILKEALAAFARASSSQQLDAELQSCVATCHHHLGRLYRRIDQPVSALEAYQKALDQWQELVRQDSKVQDHQAGLARTLLGIGNVYGATGQVGQARKMYLASLAIREKLAGDNPNEEEIQRDLAVTYSNLASLSPDPGQSESALGYFQKTQKIRESLVRDYPNVSQFQEDLAITHANRGSLLARLGQNDQAEAAFGEAIALRAQLVQKHPSVPDYQANLATTYLNLGNVYKALDLTKKVESAYQQALAIQERLAQAHKTIPAYRANLARSVHNLAAFFHVSGRLTEAQTAYERGLALREKLANDYRSIPQYQCDLAVSYNDLGVLYRARQDKEKALTFLNKAHSMWEALTRSQPGTSEYVINQGANCCNLAEVHRDCGDSTAALDWYSKALGAFESLPRESGPHSEAQEKLATILYQRAETLMLLARYGDALSDWERLLSLATGSRLLWCRLHRAVSLCCLGDHQRGTAEAEDLASKKRIQSDALYCLARVYALAVAAAQRDARLGDAEKAQLALHYAKCAIELLNKSLEENYFKAPANSEKLMKDHSFDVLKDLPGFRAFTAKLEKEKSS